MTPKKRGLEIPHIKAECKTENLRQQKSCDQGGDARKPVKAKAKAKATTPHQNESRISKLP